LAGHHTRRRGAKILRTLVHRRLPPIFHHPDAVCLALQATRLQRVLAKHEHRLRHLPDLILPIDGGNFLIEVA
jgi:hypothetical protein